MVAPFGEVGRTVVRAAWRARGTVSRTRPVVPGARESTRSHLAPISFRSTPPLRSSVVR